MILSSTDRRSGRNNQRQRVGLFDQKVWEKPEWPEASLSLAVTRLGARWESLVSDIGDGHGWPSWRRCCYQIRFGSKAGLDGWQESAFNLGQLGIDTLQHKIEIFEMKRKELLLLVSKSGKANVFKLYFLQGRSL